MRVESPLELFTTLYGWFLYESFWTVLAQTGIVFVPLGWAIVSGMVSAGRDTPNATETAVRSRRPVIINGTLIMAVVLLAAVPLLTLTPGVLSYERHCRADPVMTAVNTNTLYDEAFDFAVNPVQVPAWWRFILSVSSGINAFAVAQIGCTPDIATMRAEINKTRIKDPDLLLELEEFTLACWIPSRSKLQREKPVTPQPMNREHDWLGADFYLNTPGYYDRFYPQHVVKGWPVDLNRDTDKYYFDRVGIAPQAGIPHCKEWWADPDRGLYQKLTNEFPQNFLLELIAWESGKPDSERIDQLIKGLLNTVTIDAPASSDFAGAAFNTEGFSPKRFASNIGLAVESFFFGPQMEVIKAALPIVKAFLMMGAYMLLPIVMLAGGYKLETLIVPALGIIALNFLSVLWHIAFVLEQNMIESLWGDGLDYVLYQASDLVGGNFGFKVQILKYVLVLNYLVFPLIFILVLGWAGSRVLSTLSNVMSGATAALATGGRSAVQTVANVPEP